MRSRLSARLLLLDAEGRVLLFRFVFESGALAGRDYWATPGGAVDEGESFVEAARRELREETGIVVKEVGEPVAEREFVMLLSTGEEVMAREKFFVVRVTEAILSRELWTELEEEVMAEHRWWSAGELEATKDTFYPENLVALLGEIARGR